MRTLPLRHLAAPLILLFALPAVSGCFYSRELAQTRKALERQHPGMDLDTRFTVTFGPRTMRFTDWVLHNIDGANGDSDDDVRRARAYLREVRSVKVGIYHVDRFGSQPASFEPGALDRFDGRGWTLAVAAEDRGDRAWVMYREGWGRITDMFVLAQDDRDLVVLRLEGRLDNLLRLALEDYATFDSLIEIDL
jgi:hypothetical protein